MNLQIIRFLLLFLSCVLVTSCDNNDSPGRPGNEKPGDEETFSPHWDYIVETGMPDSQTFIGTRYLGIDDRNESIPMPPSDGLYVGCVCKSDCFGNSFDDEVTGDKNQAGIIATFGNGWSDYMANDYIPRLINYVDFMKSTTRSQEYADFIADKHSPGVYGFCNLESMDNLKYFFSDNMKFAEGIAESIRLRSGIESPGSLMFGKAVFKGMTVALETPGDGIFKTAPADAGSLVYIKSLTYGASAYFVVVSDKEYADVMACFNGLGGRTLQEEFSEEDGVLRGSEIYTFIIDDVTQNARVGTTVDSLIDFMANPFKPLGYGYPLYVDGRWLNGDGAYRPEK